MEDGGKKEELVQSPLPWLVFCPEIRPLQSREQSRELERPRSAPPRAHWEARQQEPGRLSAEGSGQPGADGSQMNCLPSRRVSGKKGLAVRQPQLDSLSTRPGEVCGPQDAHRELSGENTLSLPGQYL